MFDNISNEVVVALFIGLSSAFLVDRIVAGLRTRGIDLPKIVRQIKELHEWHDKEDDDGVKIWYVRASLTDAISRISRGIEMQNTILDRLQKTLDRMDIAK